MKIMFLNVWHGAREDEINSYLETQRDATDVFCFQESISPRGLVGSTVLTDFTAVEAPEKRVGDNDISQQAVFVASDHQVDAWREIPGLEGACGVALYVKILSPHGQTVHLVNFHGLSRPINKLDDPDRLRASRAIIDFCRDLDGLVVIGGDFNLFPETESIRMFVSSGYRDLIAEYGVETPRNHFVWDRYPETKYLFSDFAFVNSKVKVIDFVVPDKYPDNQVSDHLPLLLEIEA